ncbi:hypothetical protein RR46_11912 [Papilio xuthus]|uniref:Uncharacterized protein n=1 Tax=Papilio xuthus TaxID=66420 RepID=A0A194PPK5_PAPXU|nr:hypothetical protein RR46_11912 [Papilio xuthus]
MLVARGEVSVATTRAHVVKEIEKLVGRVRGEPPAAPALSPPASAAVVADCVACVLLPLTARLASTVNIALHTTNCYVTLSYFLGTGYSRYF